MITALFSVMLLDDAHAAHSAHAPVASEVPAQVAEARKEERKICKREQVTGSNRTKRLCMTASQWKAYESGQSSDGNSGF